ncbi:MAG TPA: proton-conducting transporter membrane subunit [Segeticoccus sp.]|nr:proton-conducting transporter membrane subunit [Segeticoccus sp.]
MTGAVMKMVNHGLITAALFLLAGVLLDRGGSYDLNRYGGLAGPAPRFAAVSAVAAFASLGVPGFSGFIAEFQILAGSLGPATAGAPSAWGAEASRTREECWADSAAGSWRGTAALSTTGDWAC